MLEVVGVPPDAERLYLAILDGPPRQVGEIAAAAGMTRRQVEEALPLLEARGLANRTADANPKYLANPPGPAIEGLVLARQQELEELRIKAAPLHDRYRAAAQKANTAELVQVLTGDEAIRMQWYELQRSARDEIRMFDVPPYLAPGLNELELDLLKQGVRYRVLYDQSAIETPGQLPLLEALTDAGEEARVLRGLPMKLDIADQSLALMPLEMDSAGTDAIVVRGSALLETLISYFDFMWDRAVPIDVWRFGQGSGRSRDRRRRPPPCQPPCGGSERPNNRLATRHRATNGRTADSSSYGRVGCADEVPGRHPGGEEGPSASRFLIPTTSFAGGGLV